MPVDALIEDCTTRHALRDSHLLPVANKLVFSHEPSALLIYLLKQPRVQKLWDLAVTIPRKI